MKKDIRNIGIITESKEDKIVLIEKMAFYMDAERTNNAPLDWMRCEVDKDMVRLDSVTTESWRDREINMVNVPSQRELDSFSLTMQVLEGSVTHISALGGLTPLMIELWKRRVKDNISSVVFVGKIAKKGADFFALVQEMQERLSSKPLLIQLPIKEEDDFEGVVDLISMKELIWEKISEDPFEYRANNPKIEEIRPELMEQATNYRQKMLEQIAEVEGNERLMEKFLEDEEITTEEITQAIRVATISMAVAPVVMGCLSLNMGVRELLDAMVEYLPSPLDVTFKKAKELESGREITIEPRESEPFVGLVLAVVLDPFMGELVAVRIYRGILNVRKNGMIVHNSTKDIKDRVGRIVKHKMIRREELGELFTGEIGYLKGLKNVHVGDTLCDPLHKVILEIERNFDTNFMVRFLIRDDSNNRRESILNQLIQNNPSCRLLYGKTPDDAMLFYGESVSQLNYLIDKLRDYFKFDIVSDEAKIAHYYTLGAEIEKEYIYQQEAQQGRREHFTRLSLKLEPLERGAGYRFVDETKEGVVPKEFISSINDGIQEALDEGIVDGYPMVDIKAILYDGSYDNVDSNEEVFRLAGYQATKKLIEETKLIKLEPIMKLNIEADEEFRETILADIIKRRGIACGRGGDEHNLGDMYVPLSEIVDYNDKLYVLTDGQASFEMSFERYEVVPEYFG
jgi:elongation factor G